MIDLLGIPAELIGQVFQYLDDCDVFAARRSNKQLEKASFARFGKRFFRKKGFMITSPSLEVLERISTHPGLNRYVQHVWFNPDCYTFARPDDFPDEGYQGLSLYDLGPETVPESDLLEHDPEDSTLQARYRSYRACMSDHVGLLHGGRLEQRLTRIFRNLPNLETIGMRRSEDHMPWGWRQLEESIGQDPRVLGTIPSGRAFSLSVPTLLFVAIINAIAETNVRMRRLYTDAIEIDNIRAEDMPSDRLRMACSSLLYLEVNAVKALLEHDPRHQVQRYNILSDPAAFGTGLANLFAAAPRLKELGLQIFSDRKHSHLLALSSRDPQVWRQSYPCIALAKVIRDTSFPNLTRIKLEKLASPSSVLQKMLEPCASRLTSLKMRDIRLISSEEDPKPWGTIFAFLASRCRSLDYILFYHLRYDGGCVAFVSEAPSETRGEIEHDAYLLPGDAVDERAIFMKFAQITLQETGREAVSKRLAEVVGQHWHHKPLFSYALDESLWHTDTSDEEW